MMEGWKDGRMEWWNDETELVSQTFEFGKAKNGNMQ